MQHKTPDHHGGYCAVKRLTEQHCHSRIPPHRNEMRINKTVCGLQQVWLQNCKLYSNVRDVMLCVLMDPLKRTVRRIITGVIQGAYVLSSFYRELPFQVWFYWTKIISSILRLWTWVKCSHIEGLKTGLVCEIFLFDASVHFLNNELSYTLSWYILLSFLLVFHIIKRFQLYLIIVWSCLGHIIGTLLCVVQTV